MRRSATLAVILAMAGCNLMAYAADGMGVTYVSGTVAGMQRGVKGNVETEDAEHLVINANGRRLAIPYKKLRSFHCRQEVRYHLGVLPAIAVGLLKARSRVYTVLLEWDVDGQEPEVATLELSHRDQESLRDVLRVRAHQACGDWRLAACGE